MGTKERIIQVAWKKWRLIFDKNLPRDTDGYTESPNKKRKSIRIKDNLVGQDFLECYLHETHHAGNDSICEDYVEQIAHDQAASFCHKDCMERFLSCPRIVAMIEEILDGRKK